VVELIDFDRKHSSTARSLGFNAKLSTENFWYTAFEQVSEAKPMWQTNWSCRIIEGYLLSRTIGASILDRLEIGSVFGEVLVRKS